MWILLFLHLVLAQFPTDTCTVEGEVCIPDSDNLLSSIPGVPDITVCEELCEDTEGCEYYSHFGAESFPLREYCMLYNSCNAMSACEDCRTERFSCSPCGSNIEGVIGSNTVDILTGVTSEVECKTLCRQNSSCQVYTFHDQEDPLLPDICILLTELLEPLQECEHCSTGFPDCRNTTAGFCLFRLGTSDTPLTSYKFTDTGSTAVNLLTLGDCVLTAVAVGGGGLGLLAGGGSGYVNSTSTLIPTSSLVVTVGGPREHSGVITGQHTIISAPPGQDYAPNYYAGDGYSGGGAGGTSAYYGDGGEDGGDGCCNRHEGAGSGLDVSSISLQHFSITPGRGGQKHTSNAHLGGGGGGVLVDGEGPRDKNWDGQGYGGGMGGYNDVWGDTPGSPGPGIVLLEIKPKQ